VPRILSVFRLLSAATLVAYLCATYISAREMGPVAQLLDTVDIAGTMAKIPFSVQVYSFWTFAGIAVASFVGLMLFMPIARIGLLVGLVASPVYGALSGVLVASPLSNFVYGVYQLLFTVLFGLAFFHPPVRAAFEGSPKPSSSGGSPHGT
jgi:hypothetical protein